jgi:hypothetical protein
MLLKGVAFSIQVALVLQQTLKLVDVFKSGLAFEFLGLQLGVGFQLLLGLNALLKLGTFVNLLKQLRHFSCDFVWTGQQVLEVRIERLFAKRVR